MSDFGTFIAAVGVISGLVAFECSLITDAEAAKPTERRDTPVYGYRRYQVGCSGCYGSTPSQFSVGLCLHDHDALRLYPVFSFMPCVTPGNPQPAQDRHTPPDRKAHVRWDNHVGYYACKRRSCLPYAVPSVYGEIAARVMMWGTIIEHEAGYRAQYMYPDTLYFDPTNDYEKEQVQELARVYGCEIAPYTVWEDAWTSESR